MLLSSAPDVPVGPGYAYEPKVDGMRALVSVSPAGVRLFSRRGRDWTDSFPELAELERLDVSAILDGELAVVNADGRADFDLLGKRLMARAGIQRLSLTHPAKLYAFDLIELRGRSLCGEPWTERRRLLESLDPKSDAVRLVPYSFDGPTMHALTATLRYEGTIAKRCRSRYFPNQRTKSWVKTKHRHTRWFPVLGWKPPSARHPAGLVVTEAGQPVGTAMLFLSRQDQDTLLDLMDRYGQSHAGMLALPDASLEAEVAFTERTARGTLREAVCRRLRIPGTE
jgi:bifunctional non-homologous end joining protein LigD